MKRLVIPLAFCSIFLAAPMTTFAASATFLGPIVPAACNCPGAAPDYGCVLAVVQNLINFGITLGAILFTIYLVITGFSFVTSAGSGEARSAAKTRFMNVFIGLAVLLCAWLIVDFVMKTLYNSDQFGPWNSILSASGSQCIVPHTPHPITAGSIASNLTSAQPGTASTPSSGGSGTSGLSINTAISSAMANKFASSQGKCAAYVEKALAAGGVSGVTGNGNSIGPSLVQHGFTQVATGVVGTPISGLQPGDVVSISAGPSDTCSAAHKKYGHTEIYTGDGWVSDYYSSNVSGFGLGSCAVGDSVTVYRP